MVKNSLKNALMEGCVSILLFQNVSLTFDQSGQKLDWIDVGLLKLVTDPVKMIKKDVVRVMTCKQMRSGEFDQTGKDICLYVGLCPALYGLCPAE